MMLWSPGGQPVDLALKEMSRGCLSAKMKESLSEMHFLHVLHKDPAPRNRLYNPESKKVVFFDFETGRDDPGDNVPKSQTKADAT